MRSARLASPNYLNTAYPAGLARILAGMPERYAVLDCGTTRSSSTLPSERRTAAGGASSTARS